MIDKTKDGVEEIDGQSAEVSVSVDGGESESNHNDVARID